MREIRLYGALGKSFGTSHRFHVNSVQEAIQALSANFPAFISKLRGGFFRIVVGQSSNKGVGMTEETLASYDIRDQDIHIIPVTKGSKKGLGKILAGILLIGLAVATGGMSLMTTGILGTSTTLGGTLMSVGAGLVLTGVASIIAPEQKSGDENKSYTIAGPQVTMREGGIVPIAYGEVVTGGTMISVILKVENSIAV